VGGQVTAVSRRRHRRWRAVGAFLKTLPGALTAIATLLAAVAGLLTALAQIGVITIGAPLPGERKTLPAQRGAEGSMVELGAHGVEVTPPEDGKLGETRIIPWHRIYQVSYPPLY
jgi:hypothetical protein